MLSSLSALIFGAAITLASPVVQVRTVLSLNQPAFQQAQQRDGTATRAFSSTQIKTSDGQCLFVDELSGDFRANKTPVQVAKCDGSQGQSWDIITAGKHNNQPGDMLVVSTLTQACLSLDARNQVVNLFSCGGRADGSGQVTSSQLFNFTAGVASIPFASVNQLGTCIDVGSGNVLNFAPCAASAASQTFTFVGSGSGLLTGAVPASTSALVTSSEVAATSSGVSAPSITANSDCSITFVTVTRGASSSSSEALAATSAIASSAVATTAAAIESQADANPTTPVPVSGAGGVLQPSAAAESNQRDNTATRAFSSVSIKDASGQCLFVDPTAGDFRENLIPVRFQACTGSAGEKFDFITAGIHNNAPNSTLIVSSLTQGCLNFDTRKAAQNQLAIFMFSCGGRADGGGQVTNSQLFPFTAGEKTLTLAPENSNGATCLVPLNGQLDHSNCSGDASQIYTIIAQ